MCSVAHELESSHLGLQLSRGLPGPGGSVSKMAPSKGFWHKT